MQFYANDFMSEKVKQAWNNMWNSKVNITFFINFGMWTKKKTTTGHLTDDVTLTRRFILSILLQRDKNTCWINEVQRLQLSDTQPFPSRRNYVCFICKYSLTLRSNFYLKISSWLRLTTVQFFDKNSRTYN